MVNRAPEDVALRMTAHDDEPLHTANPLASYRAHKDEIDAAVLATLGQPVHVLGPVVEHFERCFADYMGVSHGVAVNSGTDALHLALRAFDIGLGEEVITVSHTAGATVAAIAMSGATPVLVDIELPACTIDPDAVEQAITSRTRAVIAVHLYGQPADIESLADICARHGVKLIEDCAQSHGATWKGRRAGGFGDAACFSFYPSKNLGTVGDGGMVLTQDHKTALRVRRLRQYGWEEPQLSIEPGWNSRMNPLAAAILGVKLRYLDGDVACRRALASRYSEALADLPLALPESRPEAEHAWHLYVIRCETGETRDALRQHLLAHNIQAGIHYPVPVHMQPAFMALDTGSLPNTEAVATRILSLPLYPEMLAHQQDRVISAIRSFFNAAP